MYYIVESSKSFYEATVDLESVILRLGYVILHVHDLMSAPLRLKEIEVDDDCKVFEICSYRQVEKLLGIDMRLNLILPSRISVFTENGATKIGFLRSEALLSGFPPHAELSRIACEIDEKIQQIVDETR